MSERADRKGREIVTIKEIVKWLNEETSCYAQDESHNGSNAILVDGILYPKDIKELAKKMEEVKL